MAGSALLPEESPLDPKRPTHPSARPGMTIMGLKHERGHCLACLSRERLLYQPPALRAPTPHPPHPASGEPQVPPQRLPTSFGLEAPAPGPPTQHVPLPEGRSSPPPAPGAHTATQRGGSTVRTAVGLGWTEDIPACTAPSGPASRLSPLSPLGSENSSLLSGSQRALSLQRGEGLTRAPSKEASTWHFCFQAQTPCL